ncbi:stress responsive protein [Sediminicola sp. YIK13]|uniref:Dabb family protein n=1 Tax=Sediminicola sp. YIK13 TaxID=1453352 RepID=UPI00071ED50B|nr:Dabb family protein [Sediminicola sp. YIK13]ALM08146.1 stress responsive protein [Sediminicola sp. YIK13]
MRKIILLLGFVLVSMVGKAQENGIVQDFDPNYVHTVFFWMKDPANEVANKKFEVSLRKFLDSSKYAKTQFIGRPPKATRDVVDDSFTYSLVLSFESAEAQENYQKEEAHLIFIEESQDLWDKVVVYDAMGI